MSQASKRETHENPPAVRTFAELIREGESKQRKDGHPTLAVGTAGLFTAPAKAVSAPLERRYRQKYEGRYRFARHLFAVDLALLLVALALAVTSVALLTVPSASSPPLAASVTTLPAAPRNGETVSYEIRITNRTDAPLEDATVSVRLPDRFRPISFGEGNAKVAAVSLGTLPPRAVRVVSGRAIALFGGGEADAERSLFAVVSGLRSGRPTEALSSISFPSPAGSVLTISGTAPASQDVGAAGDAAYRVKNDGGLAFGPLTLELCPSEGLSIEAASRCLTRTIPLLLPNESATGTIRIVGATSTVSASFLARLTMGEGRGAVIFDERAIGPVRVETPIGHLTLETKPPPPALHGAGVPFTISLIDLPKGATLEGMRLFDTTGKEEELVLEYGPTPLAALRATGKDDSSAFTPSHYDGGSLAAEASVRLADGTLRTLRSVAVAYIGPLVLDFQTAARYRSADGEQLGRGPNPPKVGEKTEYWVFLTVGFPARDSSYVGDIKSLEARAALPKGVSWVGKQAGSPKPDAVRYDPRTRTIVWSLKDVPADQGLSAAFAVSVTPTAKDRGIFLSLLGETELAVVAVDGASSLTSAPRATAADGGPVE